MLYLYAINNTMKKIGRLINIDRMAYKGKFTPKNPQKYKGNPKNIIYRSSWERRFMSYCDKTKEVLEWGSEEIWINYRSIDNKIHKYFPDFYMKIKQPNNTTKKFIVEIKPSYQTRPPKKKIRKTRQYIKAIMGYKKNTAKWAYAREWCERKGMNFVILTEKHLKTF